MLSDDRKSRLAESAALFGVPLQQDEFLQDSLMPVLPRNLRALTLPSEVFEDGLFDPQCKQRILAAVFASMKADKAVRDSERWSGVPIVNPSSSRYHGPLGARLS